MEWARQVKARRPWPPAERLCPFRCSRNMVAYRWMPHLEDLTEWVRLMEARRPWSPAVRLPRPRSRALPSSRELKPTVSLRGAYGLCGFTTESLL